MTYNINLELFLYIRCYVALTGAVESILINYALRTNLIKNINRSK